LTIVGGTVETDESSSPPPPPHPASMKEVASAKASIENWLVIPFEKAARDILISLD
jgi:hypothetical protein